MNVHVTITGVSFRRGSDFTLSTALLPDVNHRAIWRDVLSYFESEQFCNSHSGCSQQDHGSSMNRQLAVLDDVDDFLRREYWPVLLPLTDLWQTDVHQIPLAWVYPFESFVSCGGDDCLEDLEGLHDSL